MVFDVELLTKDRILTAALAEFGVDRTCMSETGEGLLPVVGCALQGVSHCRSWSGCKPTSRSKAPWDLALVYSRRRVSILNALV